MSSSAPTLLIHATNVVGLGASYVTRALLTALCPKIEQSTLLCLPDEGELRHFETENPLVQVKRMRRFVPKRLSRILECALPDIRYPATDGTLVLGDLPLPGRRKQTVFVQQAHLVKPSVNAFASSALKFRVSRWLFERNLSSGGQVIVQTPVMQSELEQCYPKLRGRVETILHPAPKTCGSDRGPSRRYFNDSGLVLVYPATRYPHKNHAILTRMAATPQPRENLIEQITVTLRAAEIDSLRGIPWLRTAGRPSGADAQQLYARADALFFPSLLESFGLPLIEAMAQGLPIVCSDLPYSRWMCGPQAIYFDPRDPVAAWRAIAELRDRIVAGWRPDWTSALAKFLPDWDAVAERFGHLIEA